MTAPKPSGPHLDELNDRIKEAEEHGDTKAADFVRWQREFVKRQWDANRRRQERNQDRGR